MSRRTVADYNGFSQAQRSRAHKWLVDQWRRGLIARPSECCSCGQREGIIDAHAEDYSEPFAAGKTDRYPLCYRCHMMLHSRFRHPEAWERYRRQVRRGMCFAPMRRRAIGQFFREHIAQDGPLPDYSLRLRAPVDVLAWIVGEQVSDVVNPADLTEADRQRDLGIKG